MTEYTSTYFLGDISMGVAVQAHSGTSMVPEKRGESLRQNYAECMAQFFNRVLKLAGEENRAEAIEELERYRQGYRDRYVGTLRRRSRVMSTMIAGPSNFPTRRNAKASDSYENSVNGLVEWSNRVEAKILAHYSGREAIRTGDAGAIEALKKKIVKLEAWQQFMKDANKIIRSTKLTEDEKVEQLLAMDDDLTEATVRKFINDKPYASATPGFEGYQLSNNNATITRVKEQLVKAERLANQVTTETVIGKVRMVNNCEDDRLELYFPDRTSKEIYAELKGHGFRYTPSKSVAPEGCFQAFRGANADYWASVIIAKYNAENPE